MVDKLDDFITAACDWIMRGLILFMVLALAVGIGYCLFTFVVLKFFAQ